MNHADRIVAESLLNPQARHKWTWGVHKAGVRRASAIYAKLMAAGIDADFGQDYTYSPGVCYVTFPCADFRRAEALADTCYVGESWWPTKGRSRVKLSSV